MSSALYPRKSVFTILLLLYSVKSSSCRPENRNNRHSQKSTTLLRIKREWQEIKDAGIAFDWKRQRPATPSRSLQHIFLGPLDLYTWHFTVTGVAGSPYDGGLYHGRIVLPRSYPSKPPKVQVWTPSGRFKTYTDICLSASDYHPETWRPSSWTLRTLVESLRLHMLAQPVEIGGINESYERKLECARQSRSWRRNIKDGILVDHGAMLKYMLECDFMDDEKDLLAVEAPRVATSAKKQLQRKMRERRLQRSSTGGVLIFVGSPVRLALVGLLVLFVLLNWQ